MFYRLFRHCIVTDMMTGVGVCFKYTKNVFGTLDSQLVVELVL